MVGILAALYVVLLLFLARHFARRDGYVSLFVVFGVTGLYYFVAVPFEAWLRDARYLGSRLLGAYAVSQESHITILVMANLALIGFALGLSVSGLRMCERDDLVPATPVRVPRSMVLIAGSALGIIAFVYGLHMLVSLTQYFEKNSVMYNNPLMAGMLMYLILAMLVLAGSLLQGSLLQRIIGAVMCCVVIACGILTVDKNPIVQGTCALLTPWLGEKSRRPYMLLSLFGGAFLAVGALPLFSAYRGGGDIDMARLWSTFSVLDTDAAGPAASCYLSIAAQEKPLYGQTYLRALTLQVPRVVWPDRCEDLGEQFIKDNVPRKQWFDNMGLGFSPLAEAYINFGVLGGLIHFFIIAFFLGTLWSFMKRRLVGPHQAFWKALFASSALISLVLMQRSASHIVLRYALYNALLFFIAYRLIDVKSRVESYAYQGAR